MRFCYCFSDYEQGCRNSKDGWFNTKYFEGLWIFTSRFPNTQCIRLCCWTYSKKTTFSYSWKVELFITLMEKVKLNNLWTMVFKMSEMTQLITLSINQLCNFEKVQLLLNIVSMMIWKTIPRRLRNSCSIGLISVKISGAKTKFTKNNTVQYVSTMWTTWSTSGLIWSRAQSLYSRRTHSRTV